MNCAVELIWHLGSLALVPRVRPKDLPCLFFLGGGGTREAMKWEPRATVCRIEDPAPLIPQTLF